MRSAKVIVTDVGGKGKKIFHYGDVVTENSFPVGNFDKLIAGGFLKESDGNVEVPVEIEITETINDETVTVVTAPKDENSEAIEPVVDEASEQKTEENSEAIEPVVDEASEQKTEENSEAIEPEQNSHKKQKNKFKK